MRHKSHDILGQSRDITGFINLCDIYYSHDIVGCRAKCLKNNVDKSQATLITLFEFQL